MVTYVGRGLEAMRGFDIFVRVANRIAAEMPNVLFVVAGSDRISYGNDRNHITAKTFREHVLETERPDLRRFRLLGMVPAPQLAEILSLSDLQIYLTVPFVLSWSLLNALACQCCVFASDTAPVREVIRHGETGLLAGFFDVEGFARLALQVLKDPGAYRGLGAARRALVEERYALERTLPRLWEFFTQVTGGGVKSKRAFGPGDACCLMQPAAPCAYRPDPSSVRAIPSLILNRVMPKSFVSSLGDSLSAPFVDGTRDGSGCSEFHNDNCLKTQGKKSANFHVYLPLDIPKIDRQISPVRKHQAVNNLASGGVEHAGPAAGCLYI